jgi:hypothetical protein
MARYFIYVYYQQGNVGPHCVEPIKEQPEEGFATEQEAEEHLTKMIEARQGYYFDRNWYKFTILKTYLSKNAFGLYDKVIKARGQEWKQNAKVLDCIFCNFSTGCSSFGCCSPACEITGECFGNKSVGTWCPFGEIPEDKKFLFSE